MTPSQAIRLRPHHGLCILLFSPHGHSEPYRAILYKLIERFRAHPDHPIELCAQSGMICQFCPHHQDGICEKEEEVTPSDEKVLTVCGLTTGQRLLWKDFTWLLTERILKLDAIGAICTGCSYEEQCRRIRISH